MYPYMMIETPIFTRHPSVSLARFSICWWRHNRLLMTSHWPGNCDASTWIVLSNELDIDIHDDIHGRSCKKDLLWKLLDRRDDFAHYIYMVTPVSVK